DLNVRALIGFRVLRQTDRQNPGRDEVLEHLLHTTRNRFNGGPAEALRDDAPSVRHQHRLARCNFTEVGAEAMREFVDGGSLHLGLNRLRYPKSQSRPADRSYPGKLGEGPSDPQQGNTVLVEHIVMRDERQSLDLCLGNQHAVERISMMGW